MTLPGIPLRILTAAGLMTLALIGLVVREASARAGGQEVWLEIDGYDPRSLLTGHYVRFQLRSEATPGTGCPMLSEGAPWVALTRAGEHHVLSGNGATREAAARRGEIAVRGTGRCDVLPARTPGGGEGPPTAVSILDLGVDRLHADQTQAQVIEKALMSRGGSPTEAHAIISVGKDGKARLKGVVVAGQRADLNWF
jgi:hypothetical protein